MDRRDKLLAVITEQRRHALLAELSPEPVLRQAHKEVADVFAAIAEDYAEETA